MLTRPVVHQGLIEGSLECVSLEQMCSDAVFQTLIKTFHSPVGLWVEVGSADVFDPFAAEEVSELC